MTASKINVSFTKTEVAHVVTALNRANGQHRGSLGRSNPALDRAIKKIEAASAPAATDEPAEVEQQEGVDES